MVTIDLDGHKVEMYDGIDDLPIVRYHKCQKLLMIDSGIGGDLDSVDRRLERARRFVLAGKGEDALRELDNLRNAIYLVQQGVSPRMRAFAVLVASIDGDRCTDLSDEALEGVLSRLGESPVGKLAAQVEAVKKKIDGELQVYFPGLFEATGMREYYDIMRRRALAVLGGILDDGGDGEGVASSMGGVDALTTELLTFFRPEVYGGSDGVEVQTDRQFEDLCLLISEQLHIDPKRQTVLEFYNAFCFLQERAKEARKRTQGRQRGM